MPEIEPTLTRLEQFFRFIQTAQTQLTELRRENYLDDEMYEQQRMTLSQQIRSYRNQMAAVLSLLCRYPPQHDRHFRRLSEFHQGGSFDHSVFIMTKFSDGATPESAQLSNVIDSVKAEVTARGYVPRIALGQNYHRWLFDNVKLFPAWVRTWGRHCGRQVPARTESKRSAGVGLDGRHGTRSPISARAEFRARPAPTGQG